MIFSYQNACFDINYSTNLWAILIIFLQLSVLSYGSKMVATAQAHNRFHIVQILPLHLTLPPL